jgi:hypothetical protein
VPVSTDEEAVDGKDPSVEESEAVVRRDREGLDDSSTGRVRVLVGPLWVPVETKEGNEMASSVVELSTSVRVLLRVLI